MIVTQDGTGDFLTIGEAVEMAGTGDYGNVITVRNGIYREKLYIDKPGISLIGQDCGQTVISWGDGAFDTMPDGSKRGTFRSYTLFVDGEGFRAENLTIENTAGSGKTAGQAIALYADSDRSVFRNCRILGNQDTLFTGPLPPAAVITNGFVGPKEFSPRTSTRQYYEKCVIRGDVDFIFGSATAFFEKCIIESNNLNQEVNGYITAASTKEGEWGYVFRNCTLVGDCKPGTVYLGRPWRNYAHVAFVRCRLGDHIKAQGWHDWDKNEAHATVRYEECGNFGDKADTSMRPAWIKKVSEDDIDIYSPENVLKGEDGWNPKEE